ncbi:MAG: rhomboid family intramembrane serine protease [Planctomycetes bacterium]|nr:rhomboid family intramembrane serine protease [Planctomycetota bacterium]
MLLPIHTSIKPIRTPYANYALIIINVFIFLLTASHDVIVVNRPVSETLRQWADIFMLTPSNLHFWQFVSYAFLHGGYLHIIGNMFFLYLFGNNVNDKLGTAGYLGFYLAGAVFSGLGHMLMSSSPVLGASGAVAAVTGAYLVLFPQTLVTVTVAYWFIFIGTMEVPAIYFIAFKMIVIDNIIGRGTTNIAYNAHLAGYAFGILGILIALATGIVRGNNFDLWAMLKRWNRRRQYKDVASSGYDPFTGKATKKVKATEIKKSAGEQKRDEDIAELRSQIADEIARRNVAQAAMLYNELIKIDSENVLPQQHMLDIANYFTSNNEPEKSANAYEQILTNYKNYEYIEQIQLMLGILYSRYLNKPQKAIEHLRKAVEKLTDPGQLKMCKDELAKLQK